MTKPLQRHFFRLFVLLLMCGAREVQAQQPVADSLAKVAQDSSTIAKDSIAVPDQPADSISAWPVVISNKTLHYRFYGDGNFTRGNVNRSLIVLRAEIVFHNPAISITTNPRFTYGRQNFVLAERDSYADLFVDVFKRKRTYLFALSNVERSNLRLIDLRFMVGAGLGFHVLRTTRNNLTLTNALVYESTNFRDRPHLTTFRNSFRIKGRHSFINDKIRLNHITYLQPSLNDISNFRWNTIISMELPVSKWVTFRTSFENSYEGIVDSTRKQDDSRITFGISIGNP